MKVIVCIKQVPDTNEVRLDPKTGTLIREGVPSIINPDDRNALEEALKLKDKYKDVEIIVLTMGPQQADVALREALAMGADHAFLVSDRAFAGADTWATSLTLSAAIRKIDDYDLIFCGRQAIDGDTAQVGPQIAEKLNLPQITYVQSLKIEGKRVIAQRALEDGYEILSTQMPCLLTAIKELNQPRYAGIKGIFEAYGEKTVEMWTVNDLDVDPTQTGLSGSPTNVKQTFTPQPKGKGVILEGADKATVKMLFDQLKEKHLIS